jgi:hypothetical protein
MRNGTAYRLPPLVRLTDETGYGSWRTPSAVDYKGRSGPNCAAFLAGNINRLADQVTGSLNPTFVEFLMGYPRDYTEV